MKFQKNKQLSAYLLGLAISASAAFPLSINAAPGTLANEPLFLTNKAEPNILFMVDDSGSMDFEMSTNEGGFIGCTGCSGAMPIQITGGGYWGYFYVTNDADDVYGIGAIGDSGGAIPTQESIDALGFAATYMNGTWRARNSNYNRMYYDPQVTYKP